MDKDFNRDEYSKGYSWALSLIDTYGVEHVRLMKPAPFRDDDWVLGWHTAVGVTLERQLAD